MCHSIDFCREFVTTDTEYGCVFIASSLEFILRMFSIVLLSYFHPHFVSSLRANVRASGHLPISTSNNMEMYNQIVRISIIKCNDGILALYCVVELLQCDDDYAV